MAYLDRAAEPLNMGYSQAADMKRIPQVEEQANRLRRLPDEFDKLVVQLEERLVGVTLKRPQQLQSGTPTLSESLCPLAEMMKESVNALERTGRRLNEILQSLEI